ncbi:MAG: nucleotidyltransferase family protein [Trichlorobacter sp.]
MKPSTALDTYRDEIRNIALRHRVCNVRVFGSVVHGTDTDDSDLDLLVDPLPGTTLMDIGAIRFELNRLLTIPVDVVTPRALPARFRQQIIEEALEV